MPVLSISYDLHKEPSRAYALLEARLKQFKMYCRPTESSWFIYTASVVSPQKVYDYLKPVLQVKDKIVITPVLINSGFWTQGLSAADLNWLRAALTVKATT